MKKKKYIYFFFVFDHQKLHENKPLLLCTGIIGTYKLLNLCRSFGGFFKFFFLSLAVILSRLVVRVGRVEQGCHCENTHTLRYFSVVVRDQNLLFLRCNDGRRTPPPDSSGPRFPPRTSRVPSSEKKITIRRRRGLGGGGGK